MGLAANCSLIGKGEMISRERIERKRLLLNATRPTRQSFVHRDRYIIRKLDLTYTQCDSLFVIGRANLEAKHGRWWLTVCTQIVNGVMCGNLRTAITTVLMSEGTRLTCVECARLRAVRRNAEVEDENSPQVKPARCSGHCRPAGKGRVWAQPDCPKHSTLFGFNAAFTRKPQSFTSGEGEA